MLRINSSERSSQQAKNALPQVATVSRSQVRDSDKKLATRNTKTRSPDRCNPCDEVHHADAQPEPLLSSVPDAEAGKKDAQSRDCMVRAVARNCPSLFGRDCFLWRVGHRYADRLRGRDRASPGRVEVTLGRRPHLQATSTDRTPSARMLARSIAGPV